MVSALNSNYEILYSSHAGAEFSPRICGMSLHTDFNKHPSIILIIMFVLGFNDRSTLVGHFMSSPREREKRDTCSRDSRGDERGREEKEENE